MLEEVRVGFVKEAKGRIKDISGGWEIVDSGFGYKQSDSPLLAVGQDVSDANLTFEILFPPLDDDKYEGKLSTDLINRLSFEPGFVFEIDQEFQLSIPTNNGISLLEEGEDSREVFSYSDGEIFMSFPAKDSFQPKVTYTFYAADEDGKVFSQSNGTKIPFLTMSVEIKNSYEDPIALETVFSNFC